MLVYHYTSGEGLFGIINSSKLRCTNVKFLNDPSEQGYFEGILETVLNQYPRCREIHSKLFKGGISYLSQKQKFIASFSKNSDSLSMWNYYANGNGYNIGLCLDRIEMGKGSQLTLVTKELVYDKELQLKQIKDYILEKESDFETFVKHCDKEIPPPPLGDPRHMDWEDLWNLCGGLLESYSDGIFEFSQTFKHYSYEREEEVRLIAYTEDPYSTEFRLSTGGVLIEYISLDLDLNDQLVSVTIHPVNGELHLEGVQRFLSSKFGEGKVLVKASTIPFRNL